MNKQLTRPQSDRMFLGVCAGVANYFDVDPTLVRLLFVVSFLGLAGVPATLIYIVLALVMRSEDF